MKKIFFLLNVFIVISYAKGQTISRNTLSSAGSELSTSGASISYNIGEPVIESLNAAGNLITQGFEQPAESNLQLTLFLQGYYLNGGNMQPVLINQGMAALPNEADTIEIALYHPINFELIESRKAVLHTDGTVTVEQILLLKS